MTRDYLSAAIDAARWIESTPAKGTNLYHGTAGTVLFFLQLYRVTADDHYASVASRLADQLLKDIHNESDTSLYFGLSGIGVALARAHEVLDQPRYRDGVPAVVSRLQHLPWNECNDVVGGTAGTGLFLLSCGAIDLARDAGERLLAISDGR